MSDPRPEKKRNPHHGDMRVVLRRDGERTWHLAALLDGDIAGATVLDCDEPTALDRAQTLAGWFDAELVVERIGLAAMTLNEVVIP